jgi:hypothetical protein
MAKPEEPYQFVIVESCRPASTAGLHGPIHIRPISGQGIPTTTQVECSKSLSEKYPVGTRFKIWAKLTDTEGGGEYLYSHFKWKVDILGKPPNSN